MWAAKHRQAREVAVETGRQERAARDALAEAVIRASGITQGSVIRTTDGEVRVWDVEYWPGNPRPVIRANFHRKDKVGSWSSIVRTYTDYTLPPRAEPAAQVA